jgi:hypothetical protein
VVRLVPLALGLGALATVVLDKGRCASRREGSERVPTEVHHQVVALALDTRRNTPGLIALAVVVWTG